MEDHVTPRDRKVKESEGASALEGDPEMVQRLLADLPSSALQAVPINGRLTIIARASNRAIERGAQGFGPGTKANPETICEPFRTMKARSVGLGLTICKRIAEAHSRRIDVVSPAGSGAQFTVRLPTNDALPIKDGGNIRGTPENPSG